MALAQLSTEGVIYIRKLGRHEEAVAEIPAHRVEGRVDPTGAGDSFAVLYLDARSRGVEPAEAAVHAARIVAELISRS